MSGLKNKMPRREFRSVFKEFRETIISDFSRQLDERVDELNNLSQARIEWLTFKGSVFSCLIRYSNVGFTKDSQESPS